MEECRVKGPSVRYAAETHMSCEQALYVAGGSRGAARWIGGRRRLDARLGKKKKNKLMMRRIRNLMEKGGRGMEKRLELSVDMDGNGTRSNKMQASRRARAARWHVTWCVLWGGLVTAREKHTQGYNLQWRAFARVGAGGEGEWPCSGDRSRGVSLTGYRGIRVGEAANLGPYTVGAASSSGGGVRG